MPRLLLEIVDLTLRHTGSVISKTQLVSYIIHGGDIALIHSQENYIEDLTARVVLFLIIQGYELEAGGNLTN